MRQNIGASSDGVMQFGVQGWCSADAAVGGGSANINRISIGPHARRQDEPILLLC